jgi:hypothetical protein
LPKKKSFIFEDYLKKILRIPVSTCNNSVVKEQISRLVDLIKDKEIKLVKLNYEKNLFSKNFTNREYEQIFRKLDYLLECANPRIVEMRDRLGVFENKERIEFELLLYFTGYLDAIKQDLYKNFATQNISLEEFDSYNLEKINHIRANLLKIDVIENVLKIKNITTIFG